MTADVESLNDPTAIEEIATLTDAEAVRRRFDAHNIKYIAWVSPIFVLAGAVLSIAHAFHDAGVWNRIFATSNLVTACTIAFLFGGLHLARRRGQLPRPILQRMATNLGDWIVGLFALHFFTLAMITRSSAEHAVPWTMSYPWLAVFMWLSVRRRLTLHLLIVLSIAVAVETATNKTLREQAYVSAVMANAVLFLIGAVNSRRARRAIIAFWSGRREQAREQMRMRDELNLAREVQLSMLPEAPPRVPWLDIAAASIPATEVGGDYYDYFEVGQGLAVVCGDVAGHGLASGIVLTTLRSGFTLLRDSLTDPAAVLTRLHDLVAQTTRRRMLASAAVVLLDPITHRARIASAGHPPVIVATDGSVRSIELFAPPLGVRLPVRISQIDLTFATGDCFVLHSDGVYESRNGDGQTYGMERLESVIAEHRGETATELRDTILRDVTQFRSGAPQDDDVTVVVLRVIS